MDRRILFSVIVLVFVISGFAGIGVADGGAENGTSSDVGTVDGVSVEFSQEVEGEALETLETITEHTDYSTRNHAFLFVHDGAEYIVYTDTEPVTGSASVRGDVFVEPSEDDAGVIIADSTTFQTEGESASLDDIRDNPDAYEWEHVRVSGNLRQLSFTTDVESQLVTQRSTGFIGGESTALRPITSPPGQQARWSVLNMSGSEYGLSQSEEVFLELPGPSQPLLTTSIDTQFWMDAEVTMDAVVSVSGDTASLYVADITPVASNINGPQEIQQRGDELSDEVVRFETQVVGSTTSTQEFLTTVAPCGSGDSVLVPTGPTCVPVVTDSTIHSGVLFTGNPESMDDVVPYAGLSNHHQNMVTQPETGTYEVTGRVVAGSEIDPSLEGQFAVVVYDMDRQGDLTARGSARNNAEAHASLVTDRMKEQANSSQREWQQRQLEETGETTVSMTNAEYEESRVQQDVTGAVIVT
jgi:hypothetical protein